MLTRAKRAALVTCLHGGGTLYKQRGVWVPSPIDASEQRISGITVADLGRDGMLALRIEGKRPRRASPRGEAGLQEQQQVRSPTSLSLERADTTAPAFCQSVSR